VSVIVIREREVSRFDNSQNVEMVLDYFLGQAGGGISLEEIAPFSCEIASVR
jgi:hypothetical protein